MSFVKRTIRSFARREGRITRRQKQALLEGLPRYGLSLPKSGEHFDFEAIFGRKAPVVCEIGFGMGDALIEMAQKNSEKDYVGIEVYRPGVGSLLAKVMEKELHNIRVVAEDVKVVLKNAICDNDLSEVLVFFPDPWPKKRHHKRRLVQPDFAELISQKLAIGGTWHLATDWQAYAEHMLQVISKVADFQMSLQESLIRQRPLTKFEARGERLGHQIWDLVFTNQGELK